MRYGCGFIVWRHEMSDYNVYDFFLRQAHAALGPSVAPAQALAAYAVGTDTFADVMREMPAMSPCGADCCEAIRSAMSFAKSIRDTFGYDRPDDIANVLRVCCDVVACMIRG